jgi:hypothetical protein
MCQNRFTERHDRAYSIAPRGPTIASAGSIADVVVFFGSGAAS